jgi:hypothetical protein
LTRLGNIYVADTKQQAHPEVQFHRVTFAAQNAYLRGSDPRHLLARAWSWPSTAKATVYASAAGSTVHQVQPPPPAGYAEELRVALSLSRSPSGKSVGPDGAVYVVDTAANGVVNLGQIK